MPFSIKSFLDHRHARTPTRQIIARAVNAEILWEKTRAKLDRLPEDMELHRHCRISRGTSKVRSSSSRAERVPRDDINAPECALPI